MRRKRYPVVTALLICAAIGFSGCSKSEGDKKADTANEQETYVLPSQYKWSDCITLGNYKDLKGEKSVLVVTDEDVEDEISYQLTSVVDVTDRGAKKGDIINIDYVGKIDGKEFENGSEEDAELVIGDYEYVKDLENGLVGAKTGDSLTIPVTFPKDYDDEDLKGKSAEFTVKVNSLQEEQVTPLTEDYVKNSLGYNSVDEYKAAVRKELEDANEQDALATLQEDLLTEVAENSKLTNCPDGLYKKQEEYANDELSSAAELFGLTLEEYKTEYYPDDDFDSYVKELVLKDFIFQAISETENITLSDAEYKEMAQDLIDEELTTVQEVIDYYGESQLKEEFLKQKVYDFLVEKADVTETVDDGSDDEFEEDDEESSNLEEDAGEPEITVE